MTTNDSDNIIEFTSENIASQAMFRLKYLSIQATLVRGLLASDSFFCKKVEEYVEELCKFDPGPIEGMVFLRDGDNSMLSQGQIAELFGMKPDEFALFTPFLRRMLRSIGYTKPEIHQMLEHYTWATPNFTLPQNVKLTPPEVVYNTIKKDSATQVAHFTHCYWDESVEDFRVAAKAPPLSMWASELEEEDIWPRKERVWRSFTNEIRALNHEVSFAKCLLAYAGLNPDEVNDLIARFTWTGPKYGVSARASA